MKPNSEVLRNSEMSLAFFLALCFPFLLSLLLLLLHCAAAQGTINNNSRPICPNFQCRELGFFGFPFYNSTDPRCGLCRLICNETVPLPVIQLAPEDNRLYYVLTKQQNDSLFIRDEEFQNLLRTNSCDAINHLTFPNSPSISYSFFPPLPIFKCNNSPEVANLTERHFNGSYHRYRDCKDNNLYYRYPANYADTSDHNNFPHQCSIVQLPHTPQGMLPPGITQTDLFQILASEFTLNIQISEDCLSCHYNGGLCQNEGQEFLCVYAAKEGSRKSLLAVAIGTSLAAVVITVFLLVCFWRKCSSCKSIICPSETTEEQDNFEVMLKNFGPIAAERFRYSDIKKMTNSFKQTLGQGGFGHVYRGKLCNGKLVAVKVLNGSKGNGEDFINEIASISRTSHVNIVNLLGFCFEGRKRALVYEFMPNGSLEKFIYDQRFLVDRQLEWETLYQISIGIARGLEYLHRGCSTRILHFDIKPHNILLDENFCPKIADFGLAKLCPGKESILSTMIARGTVGYIAPEVFCKNFGGVSYKSDVYSYGMMVSEMVGGRKNIDVRVSHTSEIYFPHWIYKQLESNNELGLHGIMNEEENKIARRMIIVSLWCIQTDPLTRPSMTKVVEMLEGSLESLQIPPKPYLSSPSRSPTNSLTTEIS